MKGIDSKRDLVFFVTCGLQLLGDALGELDDDRNGGPPGGDARVLGHSHDMGLGPVHPRKVGDYDVA